MLSLQAAESAHITTEMLDAKNIAIVAKPNSLLSGLVATTFIDYDPVVQNGEFYHNINQMCAVTDEACSATGYSEHTARMEELSDILAEKVTKHLFTTRTVVAPYVDAYASRLNAAMQLISANPDNGIEVVVNSQPGPMAEPALVDSFMRSKNVHFDRPQLCCDLPQLDDNEIRAMLNTGSASVDASIMEHFSKKEEGWLASRWKDIFTKPLIDAAVSANGLDSFITGRDNVDTALFVFLITRRIWNAPIDGTNMSADNYEDAMVAFRNQSALRLCLEHERLERNSQDGILIIGTERTAGSRRIIVNASVYRDFLKQGGTNEILLGNSLQANTAVRLDEILAKKDLFASAWDRQYANNKNYYDQKRLLQMREIMVIEWEGLAREYSAEDFALHERASALGMVKRLAQKTTAADFDNINNLALSVTCQARFYKTDAYELLKSIARQRENNPALSVQEAASIATSEYVCRWIGKQLVPVAANRIEVFTSKDTQLA